MTQSTQAKWLSRDPLRNAEILIGPNLYSYVDNDLILGVDPLGLLTLSFGVSWSGAYGYGNAGGSFGIIVDTSGNIGTYGTLGGGTGVGSFAGLFVQAQVTDAQCIKDTSGKGATFAGEFGDVFDGSGEFNEGIDHNGNVYNGFGLSAGVGEGAAYSQQATTTTIRPLN